MTKMGGEDRARYLKLKSVVYDRTTGLPSYPLLVDRLRTLLDDRSRIGVLAVTIDNLELVESLYGWQVLDRILARVAFVLAEAKGAELPDDVLLAVNGVAGDRFAAFVPTQPGRPEVDAAFLTGLGRQLRRRLDRAFAGTGFLGLSPKLAFRVGHALVTHDPFYRFERRVYAALEQAGSFEQRRERRRELSWHEELQKILEAGALDTLFQPVVDLDTREVLGYEALARGPKDTLFEKPRAMFALSRRVGASEDLDRQCRRAALKATAGIQGRRKIFLNSLAPGTAGDRARWDELLRELEEVAMKPGDLVLEFSDREAEGDADRLVKAIAHLKEGGFEVALDDVGTGYASQAVLESARPDYLKLDVSLVRGVDTNLIKQEILHSLVRIAGRIDADVIAEGVETEEEARTLLEAGTRYAQGYLFARPAPATPTGRRGDEREH